jgi:hypothetical protein
VTVTSQAFKGDEERAAGDGGSTEALLKQLAADQNAPAAKGGAAGAPSGPRRAGTAQPVPAGNDASTGANGPLPAGPAKQPGPSTTGAGKGSKTVKRYSK